jgi:hypothetical protein
MALKLSILVAGIESAFTNGIEGADVEAVIEEITTTIVLYSTGAEILMLPGPIQIPGSPPVPSTGQGATLKVTTTETGRDALKKGIKEQFEEGDPTFMKMAVAVQAYVNASFTIFSAAGHTATGTTTMSAPPALTAVLVDGLAGSSVIETAGMIAALIHTSYMGSVFSGAGTAVDGGLGTVSGQTLT